MNKLKRISKKKKVIKTVQQKVKTLEIETYCNIYLEILL